MVDVATASITANTLPSSSRHSSASRQAASQSAKVAQWAGWTSGPWGWPLTVGLPDGSHDGGTGRNIAIRPASLRILSSRSIIGGEPPDCGCTDFQMSHITVQYYLALNPVNRDLAVFFAQLNADELTPQLYTRHAGRAAAHKRVKHSPTGQRCAVNQPIHVFPRLRARVPILLGYRMAAQAVWFGPIVRVSTII